MNKLVKGSIAGAAGIALLLGGAGTLAYWNDSATLSNAGTVGSGKLDIADGTGGAWVDTNNSNASIDISEFKIVPGDNIKYTESFVISAVGDNLAFTIANTVPATLSNMPSAGITSTYVVKESDTVVPTTTSGTYTDLPAGDYTVDVSIVVDFPSSVDEQIDQNKVQALSAATVTVTQTP